MILFSCGSWSLQKDRGNIPKMWQARISPLESWFRLSPCVSEANHSQLELCRRVLLLSTRSAKIGQQQVLHWNPLIATHSFPYPTGLYDVTTVHLNISYNYTQLNQQFHDPQSPEGKHYKASISEIPPAARLRVYDVVKSKLLYGLETLEIPSAQIQHGMKNALKHLETRHAWAMAHHCHPAPTPFRHRKAPRLSNGRMKISMSS